VATLHRHSYVAHARRRARHHRGLSPQLRARPSSLRRSVPSSVPPCLRHNTTGFASVQLPKSHTAPTPARRLHARHRHQLDVHTNISGPVPVALLPPGSPGWPWLLNLRIQAPYKPFRAMDSDYGRCIMHTCSYKVHAPLILCQVFSCSSERWARNRSRLRVKDDS
jgi:hypothetical protein